ncbi:uncharacterized protein [Anoplolepis gracilipes]|uniref:uncharacterized protein n=1 Tax=Anoplolepis gracilipes TaxID=354296 RepID=UPI003BA25F36
MDIQEAATAASSYPRTHLIEIERCSIDSPNNFLEYLRRSDSVDDVTTSRNVVGLPGIRSLQSLAESEDRVFPFAPASLACFLINVSSGLSVRRLWKRRKEDNRKEAFRKTGRARRIPTHTGFSGSRRNCEPRPTDCLSLELFGFVYSFEIERDSGQACVSEIPIEHTMSYIYSQVEDGLVKPSIIRREEKTMKSSLANLLAVADTFFSRISRPCLKHGYCDGAAHHGAAD